MTPPDTAAPLLPARPGRYRNERLNELAALKDGWDSYGAPALFGAALRTADALTFVPTGEGGVQIELHAGGVEVEITVTTTDEVIAKDPTVAVETPKIDHDAQRRTWLTTLQFSQLLHFSRSNARSHAMVVALGMLGLRIAEMCSLDVTDVRRLIGVANVTFIGKGGRTFTLDLPLEVLTAFDRVAAGRTSGPLFLARDTGARWAPADVRRHLATLVRHAGLGGVDITPHGLRRTAARTLAERGVELGAIQEFLRHKDPRVTKLCYIGSDSGAGSLARQLLAGVYANTAR